MPQAEELGSPTPCGYLDKHMLTLCLRNYLTEIRKVSAIPTKEDSQLMNCSISATLQEKGLILCSYLFISTGALIMLLIKIITLNVLAMAVGIV